MENNPDIAKDMNHVDILRRKGYVWGTICALSAVNCFILYAWAGFPPGVLMLSLGLISGFSLIMVLKLNAEAVHKQTNEEIAFIHLETSLPIGITLLVPVIGIWSVRVAITALRGKCMRSGGTLKATPPPHLIGRTSVHLGILLLILTIVIQGIWLIWFYDNFIR